MEETFCRELLIENTFCREKTLCEGKKRKDASGGSELLLQCQKRATTVSKETYDSVERDLLQKDGGSELLLLAEAVRRTKARRDETNETKRTHYIEENNFHSEHWVRRDEAGDAKRRGK